MQLSSVSIIVPVYNCEKYIARCIKSIISQTYTNWELLIVDDGSTDNSKDICDNFAKQDSRIIILHQKNHGVSSARNLAIKHVRGTFVLFIDADDWVETTLLQTCMQVQDNTIEAVQFSFTYWTHNGVIGKKQPETHSCACCSISKENLAIINTNTTCGWFLRRNIIDENSLKFDIGMIYHEDGLFTRQYLSHCHKIAIIPNRLYNVFENNASATRSINYHAFIQSLNLLVKRKDTCIPILAQQCEDVKIFYDNRLIDTLTKLTLSHHITINQFQELFNLMSPKTDEFTLISRRTFVRLAKTNFHLAIAFMWFYHKFIANDNC